MGRVEDEYAISLLKDAQANEGVETVLAQAIKYSAWLKSGVRLQSDEYDSDTVGAFLVYLKKKGRENLAEAILDRFTQLASESLGVLIVHVVSAFELSEEQLSALRAGLLKRLNKTIHIIQRVDPSLIAGLRLNIGGKIMDATIKKELTELKKNFYRGVYLSGENRTL